MSFWASPSTLKAPADFLSASSVGLDSLGGGGGSLGAAGLATGNPVAAAVGFGLDLLSGGGGLFGSKTSSSSAKADSGHIQNNIGGLNVPSYPFASVPSVPGGSIVSKKALDISPVLILAVAAVGLVAIIKKRKKG